MNREYHRWYSKDLGRDMELLVFGHAGLPVLVFPTSYGRFYDWEDRSMVGALAGTIEAGNIRLYCIDSVDAESWHAGWAHPRQRVERYLGYEGYILHDVLPLILNQSQGRPDPRIAVTGCSLGAFQGAVLTFRHPQIVGRFIGLSGKYDNTSFLSGYSDDVTYFTNPLAFLRGLGDPCYLDAMRAMDIVIVTGSTDPHVEEAYRLSRVLWEKGVPNTLDVWEGWVHDWPYWHAMIVKWL